MKNESERAQKTVTIIVNGRSHELPKEEVSFTEIVAVAFEGVTQGGNIYYTVTYKRGHGNKPEGTLVEGQGVKVKDGMVFNVTRTDKS